MGLLFEEIDSQPSPIGEISLRRRRIPAMGDRDIYEVKLGDEFLMSSLFYEAEIALADLGLAALMAGAPASAADGEAAQPQWDIVVGGLGLGYTAVAALSNPSVATMLVVDALDTVINWHKQELVPLGKQLNEDPRCHYVHGNFFELAASAHSVAGFDQQQPGRLFHAILLDIDHSPRALLDAGNASFYTVESLGAMARQLHPGGVFAMWSNDPPDAEFMAVLSEVFASADAQVVPFFNHFQNTESTNTIYVARL